jgi:hypothetical protein
MGSDQVAHRGRRGRLDLLELNVTIAPWSGSTARLEEPGLVGEHDRLDAITQT